MVRKFGRFLGVARPVAEFQAAGVEDPFMAVVPFHNGYSASVVRHSFSYGGRDGLMEIAVLDADGELVYDTPVTDDVEGWLTDEMVLVLLEQIEALPAR